MLYFNELGRLETNEERAIISTLKDTSLDDKNKEYMVASMAPVYDMDAAMRSYVETLPEQDGCPRSVDALLCGEDGVCYLIEFKNGFIKKDELLNKLYATLLMLQDVCSLTVKAARSEIVFVLVYNSEKLLGQGNPSGSPSQRINEAQHFGHIRRSVTRHAKEANRPMPRNVVGVGNSIKGIFVKDYLHCDKGEFESVLSDALHGEANTPSV